MEHTKERQERMLKQLLDYHIIDQNTYKNACEEKIVLKNRERIEKNAAYASFVHYELQELVASQMEFDKDLTKEEKETLVVKEVEKLLTQGIKIYTAYDENAQQVAETAFHNELDSLNVQGAVVIINHQNYTIPAIIGGKNVGKFEFNRAYQGERQPGSAIKPLLVYAPYLETFQVTPYDTVDANNVCFGEYCPKNYGGGEYGIVTLKTAMTYSYNTPAVRLLNETGIDTAFSYLEPFQWTHITQDDRYLSAALGAVNVTPLEITNALSLNIKPAFAFIYPIISHFLSLSKESRVLIASAIFFRVNLLTLVALKSLFSAIKSLCKKEVVSCSVASLYKISIPLKIGTIDSNR